MFNTNIEHTPLTNNAADRFFSQRITGHAWNGDRSFLSTLRALIFHRMNEGETVNLVFTNSTYDVNILEGGHSYASLEDATLGEYGLFSEDIKGMLQVHDFRCTNSEANKGFIHLFEENFVRSHSGWVRIDKITDFYSNMMRKEERSDVVCYVSPSERKVLLLCERLTLRILHYLQCGILAYMPWYFNQDDGVTELEMELIESLRMKTSEKYLDCLQRIADEHDFQTEYIKAMLADYETEYERNAICREEDKLSGIRRDMEDLNSQYAHLIQREREINIKILGLKESIANNKGESEVMHFFLNNDNLFLEDVSGTQITFIVKGYIEFFDPEMAENMIESGNSYVYRVGGIPRDDLKMLMKALFVDPTLRIRTCAAYRLDIGSESYNGVSYYSFDSRFNNEMPNWHIQRFSCLGNYQQPIREFLRNNDIAGAISQCVASCKSLAFGDPSVMGEFMACLCKGENGNNKCIELPDGSVVRPKQAIAWLKSQETDNESTEQEEQNNE